MISANIDLESLRNSVPIAVKKVNGITVIEWIEAGDVRFTEPFFEDTILALRRKLQSHLLRFETSLDQLAAVYEQFPGGDPTGFIFHVSRCGSTLVSQMLAASGRNIVISEAPPIDSIIRMAGKGEIAAESLNWIVNAYAPKKNDSRYFIKFDSWSVIDLGFILEQFPDVPWIFVYRDPVEVMVSLLRKPGLHMVPGLIEGLIPEMDQADLITMPRNDYCARVLARFCEAALSFAGHPKGMFVNYTQLPGAVLTEIAQHFRVEFLPGEIEKMKAATKYDAKSPHIAFSPDSGSKHAEASNQTVDAATKWVEPLYLKLEALRTMDQGLI